MVDGPYKVLWSKTPITEETDYLVLTEGELERGTTKVTLNFTIPEASYGTNYVQFRRNWRPEDPYGFMFNVLADMEVEPSSASPGSTVTVEGTGFTAGDDEIELAFDGEATELAIVTNDLGSFTAEFTVPDTIAGTHGFAATTASAFGAEATTDLQVVPAVSLNPRKPDIGAEVTLAGRGFAATSEVTVEYDGVAVGEPTPKEGEEAPAALQTDKLGNFTASFTVPDSSEEEHQVVATDAAGNTATFGLPLEGEAPPAPATVSPQTDRFGWFGSEVVGFTWTESTDPSGVTYTVEVCEDLNFFPLEPGMRKADITGTTCHIELNPGTYYWRVKAIDAAGNESKWTLSPYAFKVGLFSVWYLVLLGLIALGGFIFIIRAFFRRVSQYY